MGPDMKFGIFNGSSFRSLESIRESRNLTISDAAILLEISDMELVMIENGDVCVLKPLMIKIDRLYNISGGRIK
ncbi:MAG: helix-turn-helix transcriptional regulator [Sphaerochaeta sp.]|nr:helix-turn-helix transcriptional regulator [Sphaerochaeta sp.]